MFRSDARECRRWLLGSSETFLRASRRQVAWRRLHEVPSLRGNRKLPVPGLHRLRRRGLQCQVTRRRQISRLQVSVVSLILAKSHQYCTKGIKRTVLLQESLANAKVRARQLCSSTLTPVPFYASAQGNRRENLPTPYIFGNQTHWATFFCR